MTNKPKHIREVSVHASVPTMNLRRMLRFFLRIPRLEKAMTMADAGHISLSSVRRAPTEAARCPATRGFTATPRNLWMSIDAQTLRATTGRYDEMCAAGVDDDFGKDPVYLDHPVGQVGPFYAIKFVPSSAKTMGGVETDLNRQVLREDGSAIEGLFAVGGCSNKYNYNRSCVSGSLLTFCSTDGRIAGAYTANK